MNPYSLDRLLGDDPIRDAARFGRNADKGTVMKGRLDALVQQRSRMLRDQNTHPLGTNPMRFYSDIAAMNQGIAALGQKVANPKAPIRFEQSRGRVSEMNATQAANNGQRIAQARAGAQQAAHQGAELEMLNDQNDAYNAGEITGDEHNMLRRRDALTSLYSRR
jgi:hypothetical protein